MFALDKEGWGVVSAQLDELLDVDEEQRAVRLAQLQTRDPALAGQVSMLLAQLPALEKEHFLEGTALELLGFTHDTRSLHRPAAQ
jgi:hypothetical protein